MASWCVLYRVLMMEDRLRCHSFYVDAAKTAIEASVRSCPGDDPLPYHTLHCTDLSILA